MNVTAVVQELAKSVPAVSETQLVRDAGKHNVDRSPCASVKAGLHFRGICQQQYVMIAIDSLDRTHISRCVSRCPKVKRGRGEVPSGLINFT